MMMDKTPPPARPIGNSFDAKPGLDSKNQLSDPKKAARQHRRTIASPCDRPPATPTGVTMKFRAVEAKTHLNFKARIDWDDVTEDTSGIAINTVDRWDIEWQAVDSDGDPVEVEHSALTAATNPWDDERFLFETGRDISPSTKGGESWHVGDRVKITGVYPQTNYNGTYTITDIPTAHSFIVRNGTPFEPDGHRMGEVFNLSTNQTYHRKLRNPQKRIALRKAEMVVKTSDHTNVTSITNPSGSTYRVNTGPTNDYQVGDYVKIENASPNAYNGVWHVTNRVDSDTFEVAGDTSSVAAATTADVYIATTVFRYTTRGANGFNVGQRTRIKDCKPETDYNGTYTITNLIGEDVFDVQPPGHLPNDPILNAEVLGVAIDEEDFLHVSVHHLPRPKTWLWRARVRCRSGEGCWSAFSAWTTAVLPFDGAEPKPPAPDFGSFPITFDHKGNGKHHKIRLLFTFDEVLNWDVPGGDREEDVAAYVIQMDSSTDGVFWSGTPNETHHRKAKDGDADTTVTAVFAHVHRHLWYRCRVRTVDRFHRQGDWSDWTPAALPFDDDAPPTPVNVEIYPLSTDRVVIAWDDPTIDVATRGTVSGTAGTATLTGTATRFDREIDAGTTVKVGGDAYIVKNVTDATDLTLTTDLLTSPSDAVLYEVAEDPDVDMYAVQIAKFADVNTTTTPDRWSDVYAHDRTVGKRKAFKIRDADIDETFFARVRSIDAGRNRSVWIPAWDIAQHAGVANSDPDADGDGVVVIASSSGMTAQWSWPRRLDEDETLVPGSAIAPYEVPYRFENLTGSRLYFKKASMVCGDREAGTGEPSGADIIVQLRRWQTDDVTNDVLLHVSTPDNRLTIDIGTWHSGPETTFEVSHLDPGESVSATVVQYGSINHGRDLSISLFMSAAPPVQH